MKKLLPASLLVAALTAACGASFGTGASATSGAPSTARVAASSSASIAAASPSSASASSVIDACALLTRSDVEGVIGAISDPPSQTSAPMAGVAEQATVCAYRGATGLLTVAVLSKAITRSDFDGVMRQVPGVEAIPDIGDAAYGTSAGAGGANGASILVLKGTTYFTIVATTVSSDATATLDALKAMAGKVAGTL